jgi:hypothetical protein
MTHGNQPATYSREDRDLLIELRTRLISVESGVQEMKTGVTARLLNLESNSVNKVEFDDHEMRMRLLEQHRWTIAGGATVVSMIGGYLLQYFL